MAGRLGGGMIAEVRSLWALGMPSGLPAPSCAGLTPPRSPTNAGSPALTPFPSPAPRGSGMAKLG